MLVFARAECPGANPDQAGEGFLCQHPKTLTKHRSKSTGAALSLRTHTATPTLTHFERRMSMSVSKSKKYEPDPRSPVFQLPTPPPIAIIASCHEKILPVNHMPTDWPMSLA